MKEVCCNDCFEGGAVSAPQLSHVEWQTALYLVEEHARDLDKAEAREEASIVDYKFQLRNGGNEVLLNRKIKAATERKDVSRNTADAIRLVLARVA